MSRLAPESLKQQARDSLSHADYSPNKLFGIHIGISAGISLLLTAMTYLLDMGIASTGGLDGIGTRTLLQTAQQLLSTGFMLVLPFWEIGLMYAALRLIRKEPAYPRHLTEGFRHFGPVLRFYLLLSLLISVLFLTGFGVLLAIPILYRLRMAYYALLDNPAAGARNAMKTSWHMTRGHCLDLFQLDLRFWWFYLINVLLALPNSLVFTMETMAIPLPISGDLAFWGSTLLATVGQAVLYTLANPLVQTTYAAAYEALRKKAAQQEAPPLTPWDLPDPPQM